MWQNNIRNNITASNKKKTRERCEQGHCTEISMSSTSSIAYYNTAEIDDRIKKGECREKEHRSQSKKAVIAYVSAVQKK